MADQTFAVSCGFFDSVNSDRLYSAEEMNRPYRRLVTNGVFANPSGTASTDLQVLSASNGMNIICKAGEGIFSYKWFSNPADISITVPSNSSTVPRVDSVIVQVDTRQSGRVGNIVYRTGTPSSSPAAPSIGLVSGVAEYRIANIYVASGANAINQDAITDLRGSSSCPWVTSLIKQVDTSTLFEQYQYAYQQYYETSTSDMDDYMSEKQAEWEQFVNNLTDDLTVATNVIMLTNNYVAPSSVTTIPIGISSYDADTDILMVYANGLKLSQGIEYTVSGSNIVLKAPVSAGAVVNFIVLKSVISADIATTTSLIRSLDSKLSNFMSDSGWINFTLESGVQSFDSTSTPAVRCNYNRIYLRGAVKNLTAVGTTICTLPIAYRPSQNHIWTSSAIGSGVVSATVTLEAQTTGSIKLIATSGTIPSGAMISIATNFATDKGTSGYSVQDGTLIVTDDGSGNVTLTHS